LFPCAILHPLPFLAIKPDDHRAIETAVALSQPRQHFSAVNIVPCGEQARRRGMDSHSSSTDEWPSIGRKCRCTSHYARGTSKAVCKLDFTHLSLVPSSCPTRPAHYREEQGQPNAALTGDCVLTYQRLIRRVITDAFQNAGKPSISVKDVQALLRKNGYRIERQSVRRLLTVRVCIQVAADPNG
jgi:hypothetical protein